MNYLSVGRVGVHDGDIPEERKSRKEEKEHVRERVIEVTSTAPPPPPPSSSSSCSSLVRSARCWSSARETRRSEAKGNATRWKERERGRKKVGIFHSLPRFVEARAGLGICILRLALGSQSRRCVALIPDSATRGMTLTYRRTRRV